jgi:acylphosphatase
MRRAHVFVSGRVQGVFYRTSCADLARELGLAGWVRNAEDGRVEAVFEGSSGAVERMLAWCRTGSPMAAVQDVSVVEEEPTGSSDFRIVH